MAGSQHTHETSADFHHHRETYDGFIRMSAIGTAWVLSVVTALAIGGTSQRWGLCGIIVFLGTVAAIFGAANRSVGARAAAGVVVLGLVILLLVNY